MIFDMQDVTVDEVIEACFYIVNNNIQRFDDFEEATEESESVWHACCKVVESGDISNYGDYIQCGQNNFLEEINSRVNKNKDYLEKIKQEVEQLKSSQKKLLSTIEENENRLNGIKTKISNINKKKEGLLEMRDKIQICKLLTNTSFVYKGNSVQGYAVGPISRNIHPFEFNRKEYQKDDITNHLYDVLKKVSTEAKQSEDQK